VAQAAAAGAGARAILTFHGVDPSGSVLSVSRAELASLVASIRDAGWQIVPLETLLASRAAAPRVALTFDDGFASLHSDALPVLREAGAPATLFLTTGWLGRDNRWPGQPAFAPVFPMLRWDQVEALAAAGFTIEAHAVNHPDLRALSDDALEPELAECDAAIAARLGRAPRGFAYPYGWHDDRVVAAVRRRYRFAVTTRMALLPDDEDLDLHLLPRLDAYYLRSPRVHRPFGGARMRGWLAARRALRGVRERLEAARAH